ncbi:MAG: UDP-N-acetylmuramate dehydrogenase [Oscillospiraceae bacterium]|nr:UDP-N-acetylmuramate dehydrogenase [Oscillospiraceae bacterium]
MAAWFEQFDENIAQELSQLIVWKDEPMRQHTTFRVGGNARRMVCPTSIEELMALMTLVEKYDVPYIVLGNGSNLLVSDSGVDQLVIYTGKMDQIEKLDGDMLYAAAGASLARLAVFARKCCLTGLEFAHGIPGSLGGAVRMNAGAYGGEMCQVVTAVTAWIPGKGVCELSAREMEFSYRHSRFSHQKGIVLAAKIQLVPGDADEIGAKMEDFICRRREKQPLEYPSAGSTFKRPEGHFAGALIEQSGLKGARIGGAQVSEKHAGFIINTGDATCRDIVKLIEYVKTVVVQHTGVILETEVELVGE